MIGLGSRAAAVTGIGMVTPLAGDATTTWRRLTAGDSGVRRISRFDPAPYACQVGGEVDDDFVADHLRAGQFRVLAYAMQAADEALADANLLPAELGARFGIVVGTHGIRLSIREMDAELRRGGLTLHEVCGGAGAEPISSEDRRLRDVTDLQTMAEAGRMFVGRYGSGGPAIGLATACSSGAMALLEASRLLASGRCDVVLAGGMDSVLNEIELLAFSELGVLSTHNADPSTASRPFDTTRSGFVMSEGACFLVLERPAHALQRRALSYGLVGGSAATVSTHHLTASCPDGSSQSGAMRRALQLAGRGADDVAYVNAHGTGTADNDPAEARAIARVLGERAATVPVSSTKGATGHLIAAAGSMEAAFCLFALRDHLAPPTLNLRNPDPRCELLHVCDRPMPIRGTTAISNSFGLAGSNVSVVVDAA